MGAGGRRSWWCRWHLCDRVTRPTFVTDTHSGGNDDVSDGCRHGGGGIILLATPATMSGADPTPMPGLELARVTLPEDLPSGTVLWDVAVSDAGWVAVGYRDGGSPEPLALYSPDGTSWSVAPITGEPEGGLLSRVTAVGSGFVATGMPGALWFSPDGRSWEVRPLDPPLEHAFFSRLASNESTLYAVGCGWAGGEQQCERFGVWRSDDLRTLQPLPLPDPVFMPTGVAADETGVMTVGWLAGTKDGDYEIEGWSAWTGDERGWTTHDLGTGSALLSVAKGADGWVAVGRQDEHMLMARSDGGTAWTDILQTVPEGSAIQVVSGTVTVVAGCGGDIPVCPSEVWRLEPGGTLTPLGLGGIEPGEVVGLSGLALSPDDELLVVGSVMQSLDGPETSALWWTAQTAPADITGL